MNDKILHWASLITESQGEPSYDDVLTIINAFGKKENTMTLDEYEVLPDKDKMQIHKIAMRVKTKNWDEDKPFLKQSEWDLKISGETSTMTDKNKKKVFVHYIEFVETMEPNHLQKVKSVLNNIKDEKQFALFLHGDMDIDLPERKVETDINNVEVFSDIAEAKSFVSEEIKDVCRKHNLKLEDFKAVEGENLPSQIKKLDSHAIGFRASITEGEKEQNEKHDKILLKKDGEIKSTNGWAKELGLSFAQFNKKLGTGELSGFEIIDNSNGLLQDVGYKSITKEMNFAYWIYTAESNAVMDGDICNLVHEIFKKEDDPSTKGKKTKILRQEQNKRGEEIRQKAEEKRKNKEIEKQREQEKRRDGVGKSNVKSYRANDTFDLSELGPTDQDLADVEDVELDSDDDILRAAEEERRQQEKGYGDNWERNQRRSSQYYDDRDDLEGNDFDTGDYDYNRHGSKW